MSIVAEPRSWRRCCRSPKLPSLFPLESVTIDDVVRACAVTLIYSLVAFLLHIIGIREAFAV